MHGAGTKSQTRDPLITSHLLKDIVMFEVDEECSEDDRCYHQCLMRLANGTTLKVELISHSILYMLNILPESKVKNSWEIDHFDDFTIAEVESDVEGCLTTLESYIRF